MNKQQPKYLLISRWNAGWSTVTHSISRTWIINTLQTYGYKNSDATDSSATYGFFKVKNGNDSRVSFIGKLPVLQCDNSAFRCFDNGETCDIETHRFRFEIVAAFGVAVLKMTPPQTPIVDKPKEPEPLAPPLLSLSFEQKEILTNALHREQHIINESIRLSMLDNSEDRVKILLGRQKSLYDLMDELGISKDSYDNTKIWMLPLHPSMEDGDQLKAFPLAN